MASSPRRATSMSLDKALLDEAKALGVNLSRAAEDGIAAAIRSEQARRWQEENSTAIEAYNARIDAGGVPLSEFRKF